MFVTYLRITKKLSEQETIAEVVTGSKGAEYTSSELYESKKRAQKNNS